VRFAPIHQLRAHEYVADQIRRHIALRLIGPGESLPAERELVAFFGVGRPTVQLALRELEHEGLVETRRGRHGGTFVVETGEDGSALDELVARVARETAELREALVFRRAVEPGVARIAAAARSDADLGAMRFAAEGLRTAETEHDYMRSDTELHLAIAAATGNRFLAEAVEENRIRLSGVMALLPESDLWHRRIDDEHAALMETIESGDENRAERAMAVHVENAERGILALLAAVGRQAR
jgi:DNA-binding FadR family transcriptional regulator